MEEFKGELELLDWDKSKEALSGEVLTVRYAFQSTSVDSVNALTWMSG